MSAAMLAERSKTRLRAFAFGSVILHGVVLAGWQASPWMAGQANSVLSITLTSDHTVAASTEARLTTPSTHQIVRRTNNAAIDEPSVGTSGASNRATQETALLAEPGETKPMSIASSTGEPRPMEEKIVFSKEAKQNSVHDTQNPTPPSTPATGEADEHGQARAQIRTRLNTDLARYFDYPYAARLRGWEGTVLLAFNIEADGRLEKIRVAHSSGYAVLDDSALTALRKVERLAETIAWSQGRELTMQIPVIYRLRCSDAHGCRESRIAATDPEDR
jgi:TonB family protein